VSAIVNWLSEKRVVILDFLSKISEINEQSYEAFLVAYVAATYLDSVVESVTSP